MNLDAAAFKAGLDACEAEDAKNDAIDVGADWLAFWEAFALRFAAECPDRGFAAQMARAAQLAAKASGKLRAVDVDPRRAYLRRGLERAAQILRECKSAPLDAAAAVLDTALRELEQFHEGLKR